MEGGVTPEQATERNEDQSRERVPGYELMMVKEGDLVGIDQILDQIHGIASPVLEFALRWEDVDKQYTTLESLLKERTMEVEVKERSVMERVVELEKKEERLKEVEERERKIGLLEKSMALRLKEKEKERDVNEYLVSSLMRLVCERENGEAAHVLEEWGKEIVRLSKCKDDKSCELDKAVKEFDLKQKELIERRRKEAEVVQESFKQLDVREKELRLFDEAIKKKVAELEKKEKFFEGEQKVKVEEMELKSKEKLAELERKEKLFEIEHKAKAEEMEVKEKTLEEREKELEMKQRELEEGMDELKEKGKEVERLSKCNDDKSCELDKAVKEFDLKQNELIESRRKEAELVKDSLRQLEAREKDVSLLDESIKEKVTELEKKEKFFDAKQKVKAEEMKVKEKELDKREKELELKQRELEEVMKKKLEEREKELELKQIELEQVMNQLKEGELQERAETCKRSRVQSLAVKGSEADSLIRAAKKHKSHSHDNADKEANSACVVSASASSPQQINKACKEETDDEPEQIKIVDSEFHDFKKTMSSFMVDKIWALYDPKDCMPRLYAKIKRVTKYRLSLDVTWLEPKDEESVPVACGRFKYGRSETISHLTFSHELQPIIHGRNFIAVNPKVGETWALFRDWSESWNNNPVQHKPPYRYDLVEVILKDHQGDVGVAYLGKVKGFVSVFKHAAQHGVFQLLITPNEMHRFSHRVPSVRLSGEEKEGVPVGSFELDPAAVPSYILLGDKETDVPEVPDGSAEDIPIIIS